MRILTDDFDRVKPGVPNPDNLNSGVTEYSGYLTSDIISDIFFHDFALYLIP